MICTPRQTLLGRSYQREQDGRSMWNVWERTRLPTGLWWGNLKEKDHLENISEGVRIKMDLKEIGWRGMDWIYLTQDRFKWPALNIRIP